jgi:hypothetical protein
MPPLVDAGLADFVNLAGSLATPPFITGDNPVELAAGFAVCAITAPLPRAMQAEPIASQLSFFASNMALEGARFIIWATKTHSR